MKILAISDTHNLHRHFGLQPWGHLPDADVLVHCGDVTTHGSQEELDTFIRWFNQLPHLNKIFIAGNHDRCMVDWKPRTFQNNNNTTTHYLKDSAVTIGSIRFFGSPIHRQFGNFPFGETETTGASKTRDWFEQNTFIDVLLTHGPASGHCDHEPRLREDHLGLKCIESLTRMASTRLHLFGHVHHANSKVSIADRTTHINCAIHPWLWKRDPQFMPVTIEI